jgi:hypothetical protein
MHDDLSLNNILRKMPLHDRLAALTVSIIHDDPRALGAVKSLVPVAAVMAKHLSPAERIVGGLFRRRVGGLFRGRYEMTDEIEMQLQLPAPVEGDKVLALIDCSSFRRGK